MFSLPIPILLFLTIVTSWIVSITRGAFSKSGSPSEKTLWIFNLLQSCACVAAIATVLSLSGGLGGFSSTSILLGVGLGIACVYGLDYNLKAFAVGPFSYTTVIVSLSAIIPTLSGYFFGERVTFIQYIGIALMVVCIILSPERKKGTEKKANAKWLIYCFIAAVGSGIVGIIQKIHQNSAYKNEMAALLLTCFTVSAIVSAFKVLLSKDKQKDERFKTISGWVYPIASGLAFAFPHTINLYLAGELPAAVMFPLVNICPMIFSMVTAVILFRERLSYLRWLGVAIGILSTVLVSGIL